MRREIISGIFAIVMSFMLVGCGQSAPADNQDTTIESNISVVEEENVTEESTEVTDVESEDTNNVFSGMSAAEIYNIISHLYVANLHSEVSGSYSYNDIQFTNNDCTNIDESMNGAINSYIPVNTDVFYNKLAMCVEGFSIGNDWENYIEHIIGFVPDSRENCQTYIDNISGFIKSENSVITIVDKLKTANGVNVEENNIIVEVSTCVNDLGISEEMFAYICGMLAQNNYEVTFDGDICTINIQ